MMFKVPDFVSSCFFHFSSAVFQAFNGDDLQQHHGGVPATGQLATGHASSGGHEFLRAAAGCHWRLEQLAIVWVFQFGTIYVKII